MIKSAFPTKELWLYCAEPDQQGTITALMVMVDDYPARLILHEDLLQPYHFNGTVELENRVILDLPLLERDEFIEHTVNQLLSQDEYYEAELPTELRDFIPTRK